MKKERPLTERFNDFVQATGIPGLIADVRAHTKEVRREQEEFQRRMQWTVDNKGFKGLEEQEKRERAANRAAWRAWRKDRFGF